MSLDKRQIDRSIGLLQHDLFRWNKLPDQSRQLLGEVRTLFEVQRWRAQNRKKNTENFKMGSQDRHNLQFNRNTFFPEPHLHVSTMYTSCYINW